MVIDAPMPSSFKLAFILIIIDIFILSSPFIPCNCVIVTPFSEQEKEINFYSTTGWVFLMLMVNIYWKLCWYWFSFFFQTFLSSVSWTNFNNFNGFLLGALGASQVKINANGSCPKLSFSFFFSFSLSLPLSLSLHLSNLFFSSLRLCVVLYNLLNES